MCRDELQTGSNPPWKKPGRVERLDGDVSRLVGSKNWSRSLLCSYATEASTQARRRIARMRGKQIASHLGLVPSEKSSGDRRRLGRISKQATLCCVSCWWKWRRSRRAASRNAAVSICTWRCDEDGDRQGQSTRFPTGHGVVRYRLFWRCEGIISATNLGMSLSKRINFAVWPYLLVGISLVGLAYTLMAGLR
jgi:hypothetical protein